MHARLCPKVALHACITAAASLSLLCTAAPAQSSSGSVLPEYEGFIRIENGRFVDSNCQEFSVTGMNTWMLMEAAAGLAVIPCSLPLGMDAVQYTFRTAAANALTVVRAFAHGVNNTLPLQTSPGVYNETAFVALDYILNTAAYNGVKLLFTMGDNWQYADAKRNYNKWAGFEEDSDEFWSNDIQKEMYKSHMKAMVNRVNTFNGVRYGDDPTIFAWNLMNEPRCNCFPSALPYPAIFSELPPGCAPSCADNITSWVGEMADYLKSIDSNHLVTVGEEGFWGYNDANSQYNPENTVSPWAALTGNNFTAQHSFASIDFAGVHYWPDHWAPLLRTNADKAVSKRLATPKATSVEPFFTSWMQRHQELSALIGKPLILEELGKSVTANSTSDALQASILNVRQPFMEMVYGQFNQSLQTGNVWRGTLFWMWGYCPDNTNDASLQVSAGDADFKNVISPASLSAVFQAVHDSPLASCTQVEVQNRTAAALTPSILTEAPSQLLLSGGSSAGSRSGSTSFGDSSAYSSRITALQTAG